MSPEGVLPRNTAFSRESRTLRDLAYLGLFTVALAALFLHLSQLRGIPGAAGIGGLVALTSAAAGAVLGFLFALPRVLSKEAADKVPAQDPSQPPGKGRLLGSNTNLERVSDWLTTMIVGVGLTQLGNVNAALFDFRQFITETAKVFPADCKLAAPCHAALNAGALPIVGPMLLIFGLIAGFVGFYLFTRLKLSVLFLAVEKDLDTPLPPKNAEGVREVANRVGSTGDDSENPAVRAVLASSQPSVDETLNLMYSLLYRTNGYQQVIDLGGQLSNTPATQRPDYWFYLAAAFGQKFSAHKDQPDQEAARQSARDNALDSARRAVQLDPFYRQRLLQISDPDGPDDDLAALRSDPAFRKIVGLK